ncbi:hypothetical protein WMA08_02250 [Staphylococcus simulans]|uniref:hypothetical protein n=1 Tax=Staphylococcus simulans TaxID=1286 RepID=UPI0030C4DD47
MKTELFELKPGDKIRYTVYETVHVEGQKSYNRPVGSHIMTVKYVNFEQGEFEAYHEEGYRLVIGADEDFEKLPINEKKEKGR